MINQNEQPFIQSMKHIPKRFFAIVQDTPWTEYGLFSLFIGNVSGNAIILALKNPFHFPWRSIGLCVNIICTIGQDFQRWLYKF